MAGSRVARAGAALLFAIAAVCTPATPASAADVVQLDVPFLPQTEDLCGGAAAAMLFRFWGERHASVSQFVPLVDHAAGGIADDVLIHAIRERPWNAERLDGSLQLLRDELSARRPPMLLIEDRPGRYHYVVVVGIDDSGLLVHDPTWGPSRRLSFERLLQAWRASAYWTLRVTPRPLRVPAASAAPTDAVGAPVPVRTRTVCDAQLDSALDELARAGIARADDVLEPLVRACPDAAGPRRELAGVRFAQARYQDAERLAASALTLDPADHYAADVLGSSRFMRHDPVGSLRAWNLANKPTLDSVQIAGLGRTRYALLVDALGLPVDGLLTADAYQLAGRRLSAWPDFSSTRLSLRPDDEPFAVVDVAVVERATLPRGALQWLAAGGRAALEREAGVSLPGRTGQGETWSVFAGWWDQRPRVSLEFAAPLATGPRGVWRVNASWAAQAYGPPTADPMREVRMGGSLSLSTWVRANLLVDVSAGLDAWRLDDSAQRKTLGVSGRIERRLWSDRVALSASAARWLGARSPGFGTAAVDVSGRSSPEPQAIVLTGRFGAGLATAASPFALWSGAGTGRGRAPLLRAHPLLHDGRLDGPGFGRRLVSGTLELQHWLARPRLARVAVALFADAAAAGQRPSFATGTARHVDVGAGVRLRVPGAGGALRVDYARGLSDGAHAWFAGWQTD